MKTGLAHQLALFLDEARPARPGPPGWRAAGGPGKSAPAALRELLGLAERLRSSRPQLGREEPNEAFVRALKSRLLAPMGSGLAQGKAAVPRVGVRYSWVRMPLGRLYYSYTERGICATNKCRSDREFETTFAKQYGFKPILDPAPPAGLRSQVEAWVEPGRRRGQTLLPRFDLSTVTDFERRVLELAAKIPRGEVRPYHWLAKEAGHPAASRAVGSVMARNPIPFLIPCHRVIRADSHIGNYGCGGPKVKAWLLAWEGVKLDRLAEAADRGARLVGSDTTKIFCLPGCRHAQRLTPDHRVYFASVKGAERAGYRACKSCRPA
ncbi:MAG TPA: methylated-DNA--[protein]-cysteine S-methyltransferase [Candidatus Acidoferrales bacterium]